ncbi:hypothetical protein GOP47_0005075 [Adiantum capillus-veneris]|uniref:U5 small nuclear ribonucleoprotein TSSC4 n=1 Tax=Adiantum capillus-veneris TaxID=13818 RepID=A0A9D4V5A7_ADICA|nr:hypothetical protein GOP47_0005075 [Adiantum capillus-veneris]
MESFANRVDKVFGSLQVTSSWRLSPHDSEQQQQQRLRKHEEDDEEDDEETPPWGDKPPAQQCSFDGMEVEGDLEEEGRTIRQMVGLDTTLDYEDEEDEFDKAAFGLDESEDDRLFMKGIQEVDKKQSSSRSLPLSLYDLKKSRRDPRANHSAARARLEEDAKMATATCTTTASMETTDAAKVVDENDNGTGVKRSSEDIPASQQNSAATMLESLKPPKRVRFALDLQQPGDAKMDTHKQLVRHKPDSVRASQVPDHVRNPSKYTHYTLDWSVEDNDTSNFEAFKACGETLQNKVEEAPSFPEEKIDKIQFVHRHDRTSSNSQKGNTEEANRPVMAISKTMCVEHLESESVNGDMQTVTAEMLPEQAMDFKPEDAASGLQTNIVENPGGKVAKNYRARRDPEDGMET